MWRKKDVCRPGEEKEQFFGLRRAVHWSGEEELRVSLQKRKNCPLVCRERNNFLWNRKAEKDG